MPGENNRLSTNKQTNILAPGSVPIEIHSKTMRGTMICKAAQFSHPAYENLQTEAMSKIETGHELMK